MSKKKTPKPKKIKCPVCGTVQYETTAKYDPDKPANPGMLTMIEPYRGWGWEGPPMDNAAGFGSIECGECGSLLAPEGRFKIV